MVNLILILLLLGIAAAAIVYIYRAKKSGAACIGCPHGKQCSKSKSGCCECHSTEKKDK